MKRRSKNPRRARGRETPCDPAAADTAAGAPPPAVRRFRGWRGWLLRLVLLVLAPTSFVAVLEGGLRLGGYGYPAGFFVGPDAKGDFATNYRFGWRFFPRSLFRDPHPCALGAKPAGTLRVFVLGESAAMGMPDPSFSFGWILEVMLREQYPTRKFEVVNAAMTAINSLVVREIAGDCARHEPDLFVIYMGNNEVVGPYGPGTVFQQWSPDQALIRASLRVKSTRVGQLLGGVLGGLRDQEDPFTHWRGMEIFLKQTVAVEHLRIAVASLPREGPLHVNLGNALAALGKTDDAISHFTTALDINPDDELARYNFGNALTRRGEIDKAIEQFQRAIEIKPQYGSAHYNLGNLLARQGRDCRGGFSISKDRRHQPGRRAGPQQSGFPAGGPGQT